MLGASEGCELGALLGAALGALLGDALVSGVVVGLAGIKGIAVLSVGQVVPVIKAISSMPAVTSFITNQILPKEDRSLDGTATLKFVHDAPIGPTGSLV